MKDYLIDTFRYNDLTNVKLAEKISLLPDTREAVRLFSHLINCQYKWMARMIQDPKALEMSWWDPVYSNEDLIPEWKKSLQPWVDYINSQSEKDLDEEIMFTGFDNDVWA